MYSHLQVFSWWTTCPVVQKSIAKVPNQKVARRLKCFHSSVSSLDGLVQNCITLSWWFLHKTAAFYTEQCTSLLLLHNFEVSQGGLNQSLNNYGFYCDAIFFTCIHAHKSLSNETILIQDCWIRNTVVWMKTGRVFAIHCWLGIWTEPGQWFFSQYCIHLLRKPVRTDLLLCDRWQTSAQACTCFYTIQDIRTGYSTHMVTYVL